MKKIALLVVMAVLCLNFAIVAQTTSPVSTAVGTKLPAAFWQSTHQFLDQTGKKQAIQLSTYKGKTILLDFWACWCGACINHFMELNTIQANNPELVIIPVNTKLTRDTELRILELISGKKYPSINLKMPTIIFDETLNKYFAHYGIPYYVWINADGRVKAFTQTMFVTDANLKLLLNEKN
jgi:thiol-disulfide isomerase/thioredoxin